MKNLGLVFAAMLFAGVAHAQEAWGGVVSVRHLSVMDKGNKVAIVARTTDGSAFASHSEDVSISVRVTAEAIDACAAQGKEAITSGAGMEVANIGDSGHITGGVFYIPCRD